MTGNHAYVRGAIEIATFDGEHENRATIPSYIVGGGLAVHRTWTPKRLESTWDVTHTRTGLRLGSYFPTRQRALAFAAEARPLADWTSPGVTLSATAGLAEKVGRLIRKLGGLTDFFGYSIGRGADLNEVSTMSTGTPSRLAKAANLPVKPSASTIEKAYVRGVKEGMRRGEARRLDLVAEKNELVIRYKTLKGELLRRGLPT